MTTNVRDQYNWDGQKSTNFFDGKVNISDKTLQELHQSGLAQEYMLYGESESRSGSGSR